MSGALALPTESVCISDLYRRIRPQLQLMEGIGGLTLSGGEPMLQVSAIRELADRSHADGLPVAVETSGAMPQDSYRQVADHVDCWLFGLRPCCQLECVPQTVGDLAIITENLRFLANTSAQIIVRVPLIPRYTTNHESFKRIAEIMTELRLQEVELLPSNPSLNHYYEATGIPRPFPKQTFVLGNRDVRKAENYMRASGLHPRVIIGL